MRTARAGCAPEAVSPESIVASAPSDAGPFFDPGNDKPYRHPQFYVAPRGVRIF